MNNEIKEIKHSLQLLHAECNPKAREEDINYILDYITNLQQDYDNEAEENLKLSEWLVEKQQRIEGLEAENETLRIDFKNQVEYTNKIAEENEDYKSRIDKAVEYINKNKKVVSKHEAKDTRLPLDTFMWGVDNLLNILQNGSDDNE